MRDGPSSMNENTGVCLCGCVFVRDLSRFMGKFQGKRQLERLQKCLKEFSFSKKSLFFKLILFVT